MAGKVGKRERKFWYTYTTIAELIKLQPNTVRRYAKRGKFDPYDLKSVVAFIEKYL